MKIFQRDYTKRDKYYFIDQHYQRGKITSQVSVLMTVYLVAVSYELWMV